MYNLSNYTDAELFEIMGLVNPTDDELEEAIVSNIEVSTGELKRFFQKLYSHFFDIDDDNDDDDDDDVNASDDDEDDTRR